MTVSHESIAALPVTGAASKSLTRAMATRRFAYCLAADESAADFVAVDPDAGTIPLYLIQNNVRYQYDSADSTTAAGATCLVTSDGKRYKSDTIAYPHSVLDKDTVAQPVSPAPTVGDRYLVPTAATGTDWAGKDGKIAIYTPSGWRFATASIGQFLYVEDETAFYHLDDSGNWVAGVGSIVLGVNSVPLSALINIGRTSFIVENQTTNTPPGSPSVGVAYIIGSSPTGAWAGKVGQLAVCEAGTSWTYYAPSNGWQAYDKATNSPVRYNGSAWVSGAGAWVGFLSVQTASGSTTAATGTSIYAISGTAPTTSNRGLVDNATISYAAKRAGAKLRILYSAGALTWTTTVNSGADANPVVALFRDSETSAIAWAAFAYTDGAGAIYRVPAINQAFLVSAADANSHTYTIRILSGRTSTVNQDISAIILRTFTIEEGA
jgi:hypothetical protein